MILLKKLTPNDGLNSKKGDALSNHKVLKKSQQILKLLVEEFSRKQQNLEC